MYLHSKLFKFYLEKTDLATLQTLAIVSVIGEIKFKWKANPLILEKNGDRASFIGIKLFNILPRYVLQ